MSKPLPIGKLPPDLLKRFLAREPIQDPRVLQGPGIGLDCAILDLGDILLALKSDPITFATDEIGWYAVQVNANDIATAGAQPRWFLATLLLPEKTGTAELAERISDQIFNACREIGVDVIGGHTEITYGLDRPILIGAMIGEVERSRVVTSRGAQPGDGLLLTKGVPIEATAILAREFPERLSGQLTAAEISEAQDFLYNPGISVLKDARIAVETAPITAMHDATEGGLAMALWELAEASGKTLLFDPAAVYVPDLSRRICQMYDLNPLEAIASGALLLSAPPEAIPDIQLALTAEAVPCFDIGRVAAGPASVLQDTPSGPQPLARPDRDAIAPLFEA